MEVIYTQKIILETNDYHGKESLIIKETNKSKLT